MTRLRFAIALCVVAVGATGAAQTPRPAPPAEKPPSREPAQPLPPEAPPAPGVPRAERPSERQPAGQPVNIRLDVTIIDEGGPAPSRKSVSLTVADRQSGQVRSEVFVQDVGRVPLAVDAFPMLERDNRVRVRMTLDYQPNPGQDRKQPTPMNMRLSFGIVLDNGKKIVAAQAADPVTDRKVSVEVTATVLK